MELSDAAVAAAFPEFRLILPAFPASGFKMVYEATRGEERVALKILKRPLAENVEQTSVDAGAEDADQERFSREILTMQAMNHTSIVKIRDAPQDRVIDGNTHRWYTEEFCANGTLQELLDTRDIGECRARRLLTETLSALDYIWTGHQTVHRDIKPSNIAIDSMGRHVLLDFGIAVDLRMSRVTSTASPSPLTHAWAAPEQLGFTRANVDCRTDLFQLGIVAHQILTGMHPFYEGLKQFPWNPEDTMRNYDTEMANQATSDPALKNVINRCLQVDMNMRPRSPKYALRLLGADA